MRSDTESITNIKQTHQKTIGSYYYHWRKYVISSSSVVVITSIDDCVGITRYVNVLNGVSVSKTGTLPIHDQRKNHKDPKND